MSDAVIDLAQRIKARDEAAANGFSSPANPDQIGRANALSRDLSLPPDLVDRNLSAVEQTAQQIKAREAIRQNPVIGQWASDPRNAMLAKDDTDNLSSIAKLMSGVAGVGEHAARGVAAGVPALTSGLYGVGRMAFEGLAAADRWASGEQGATVLDTAANWMKRQQDAGAAMQARWYGKDPGTFIGSNLKQGLSNVPTQAATLVLSAMGAPEAGAALAGGQQGGQSYKQARDAGKSVGQSALFATTQAASEAVFELAPAKVFAHDTQVGATFGRKVIDFLKSELPNEIATQEYQNLNEWITLNPDKPIKDFLAEQPKSMLATAIQVAVGGTVSAGVAHGSQAIANTIVNHDRKAQAQADASLLQDIAAGSTESKVRARDPSAFAKFMAMQSDGTPAEHVYVPGEKVAQYFQSQGMDWHDTSHWDFDHSIPGQIDEALATGGDVVMKTSDFAAHLAGTPIWEALKDDARLSPGGLSLNEARALKDQLSSIGDNFEGELQKQELENQPRMMLYQSVRDKLTNAGFTQNAADAQAQLLTDRAVTRAARMGQPLTGNEYDHLDVNQALPEALGKVQAADGLDMVIAALKGSGKENSGPSLLDFIAKNGGVEDRGGDIASMGGDKWHREKSFRKKLIKPHDEAQGTFIPGQKHANSLDDMAQRAWEAGYLPEFTERPTTAQFLDVIGQELRGKPRHLPQGANQTAEMRQAAQELADILAQEGVDHNKASPKEIRDAVARYQAAREGGLEQSFNDGPRGKISFDNGRAIIDLFQARDQSTLIHESGHLFLEELKADALSPNAPDQLKADWRAVTDWFAANGHKLEDGQIPVDAHELWARGFERYLMEGKSPNARLRKIFDMFRSWLLNIYQVVDNLRSPITPEIREVMDRLVTTDEEISQAREQQNIKALFTDAAQAGMTEAEFAAYQKSTTEARDEAFDQLLYKTMQAIRQSRTKAYKDEEANVRGEVTDRVNARPEWRAMEAVKGGQRLDRQALVDKYGEDALRLLPNRVPPVYAEKGVNADELAELSGFRTGDEMVRALMGIGERTRQLREAGDKRSVKQVMIDEETQALMRERHGDPLNDGSIEEEALAAIHNGKQGEVIASELRQLGKKTGDRLTPYRLAREWAQRKISESKVVEATSGTALQRYARAAAKAAKAAEEAMLKGDVDETFRQKQAQMLNNALIAEAKNAKDRIDIAVARMGRIAKRATMKSVDQAYLDQAHGLLEQVNFRTVSQRQLDRAESFEQWAQARQAEGYDIAVPDTFANILGQTHWSRLSIENLFGLDDAVQQIMHLGRLKQKLLDGKEERDFDAVVAEAQDTIGRLPPKRPSNLMEPGWKDRFKSNVASIDAALLKVETLVDWLDGSAKGVFNRYVFKPISDAQDREHAMYADYSGKVVQAMRDHGDIKRWQEMVRAPELMNRETGEPWTMTRQQLVAMALNMGNEGNIQRLVDGYGWNEQAVRDVLDRELTAKDWQFVQATWDIIDGLWPEIEAMEKRINGLAPDKVEAVPIETSAGTLPGGYYPAVYDTTKNIDAEVNRGKESDLFETAYTRANTRASATKERAQAVKRPILLNLGVINRHLGEVIHDITHREAVMQADRFLSDRRIVKAIDDHLGREYRQQFRPWLKFVANQWAMERAGNEGLGKFLNKARANATIVGMGFRISTILTQVAGYSNSFENVGAKWVTPAIAKTAAHPIETFKFVSERSGEIRSRMDTLDRDIRLGLNQLAGKPGLMAEVQRFAFHGIGYADRMVVVPTWMGAYNKSLSEGSTEEQAIYEADKAVRVSQGSGAAKDLAAVQRGTGQWGQVLKLMTMFYSYMSAMYQRERTLGRDVRAMSRNDLPRLMARAWWLLAVPPVMAALLSGQGPGDDEDWGAWGFKQMLFNALGPIPVVRDLARPAWDGVAGNKGFDYQLSPLQRAGQSVVISMKDLGKVVRGEDTHRATRDTLETAGYATGLVPGQVAASTQFLVDVGNGDADPQSVADWYNGLVKGKID